MKISDIQRFVKVGTKITNLLSSTVAQNYEVIRVDGLSGILLNDLEYNTTCFYSLEVLTGDEVVLTSSLESKL